MALSELEAGRCIALGLSRVEFRERGDKPLSVAPLQTVASAGQGGKHDVSTLLSFYILFTNLTSLGEVARLAAGALFPLWNEMAFGRSWYISACSGVMAPHPRLARRQETPDLQGDS